MFKGKTVAKHENSHKPSIVQGIFLHFQMPDAACYMKCSSCIFHSDSAIAYSKGSGVSLSSTGVLLFECL